MVTVLTRGKAMDLVSRISDDRRMGTSGTVRALALVMLVACGKSDKNAEPADDKTEEIRRQVRAEMEAENAARQAGADGEALVKEMEAMADRVCACAGVECAAPIMSNKIAGSSDRRAVRTNSGCRTRGRGSDSDVARAASRRWPG